MTIDRDDKTPLKIRDILTRIVMAVLLLWGPWVTVRLIQFQEWKDQGPRFTSRDAENLELKVKTESVRIYDERITVINGKIDTMSGDLREIKVMFGEHVKKVN